MKSIHQTYLIKVSLDEVWQGLTNPDYIDQWGAGPVTMQAKVGSKFQLWDGDIHGKNIEVKPKSKLVQDWYSGNWEKPSRVIMTLKNQGSSILLDLLHENYPEAEHEELDMGWKEYYLGPMKEFLEHK